MLNRIYSTRIRSPNTLKRQHASGWAKAISLASSTLEARFEKRISDPNNHLNRRSFVKAVSPY